MTVTPCPVTGRVELLNMIVVGAMKRKRPGGSPPITTLGVASRVVPAVFLLRDTRASNRRPQRREALSSGAKAAPGAPATAWACAHPSLPRCRTRSSGRPPRGNRYSPASVALGISPIVEMGSHRWSHRG